MYSHAYDHRSNRLMDRCNKNVLGTLRKIKMAENTKRWWGLLSMPERAINGNYHRALGITPFEPFYGALQTYRQLVRKRQKNGKKRNESKRVHAG